MRNNFLNSFLLMTILLLTACVNNGNNEKATTAKVDTAAILKWYSETKLELPQSASQQLIERQDANQMIKNYQNHPIAAIGNTSYFVEVSAVNELLASGTAKYLHIMLARPTPQPSDPLTLVIAGVDDEGHHVYTDELKALEHIMPCNSIYTAPPKCTIAPDKFVQDTCEIQ